MRFSVSKLILAAVMFAFAAPAPVAAASGPAADTVLAGLAGGGRVILLRHANSPSGQAAPFGMTEGCVLQEGRGLDAKGFYQARRIGERLKAAGVTIKAGFTSDICRAWDTARLVAAGAKVSPAAALKTTDADAIAAFKSEVAAKIAADPSANILLVSHSNIVPLYADWGGEGEIPSGLVLIVDPADWTVKVRLDFTVEEAVE